MSVVGVHDQQSEIQLLIEASALEYPVRLCLREIRVGVQEQKERSKQLRKVEH